ncbi:hypothetical protein Ahy_A08g038331 [Arachis hypogaea]|uniref:Uncharacterized protein n=1 Tax=Arachis hypogaea TaxID=3818 RepID=A0A445BT65_ARAHY|nr:hypothetical protein Ahy_A08g038331 [Arachis hypogaea]
MHGNLGYREAQVKAASRVRKITTARCRARIYKDNWMMSKLELKHIHPCSTKQFDHYHEYRELTMHTKCVIEDDDEAGILLNKTYLTLMNELGGYARYKDIHAKMIGTVWNVWSVESFGKDLARFIAEFNLEHNRWLSDDHRIWVPVYFQDKFWTGMRSAQRSESMHAFYGGFLHYKNGLVQFVHEHDNVLGNKEQKELEDDAADFKGIVPCSSSSIIKRQF